MRTQWTKQDLVLALDLYLRKPRCSRTDKELQAFGNQIGRSSGSIYARLQNFKAVDPAYSGTGLSAGIDVCRPIWDLYAIRLKNDEPVKQILEEIADSTLESSWNDAVRSRIESTWIEGEKFTLQEVYAFDQIISSQFPNNSHVRAKIRQTLQAMRDEGFIEFIDDAGHYRRTFEDVNKVFPEQVDSQQITTEGAVRTVTVNAYERSRIARLTCINHHGYRCLVCEMSFCDTYGDIGNGFIHVHHIVPISTVGEEYVVNPIEDLLPVCPNCHAMLHRRNPPFTVDELRAKLVDRRTP